MQAIERTNAGGDVEHARLHLYRFRSRTKRIPPALTIVAPVAILTALVLPALIAYGAGRHISAPWGYDVAWLGTLFIAFVIAGFSAFTLIAFPIFSLGSWPTSRAALAIAGAASHPSLREQLFSLDRGLFFGYYSVHSRTIRKSPPAHLHGPRRRSGR
jgi:hypothetical protein